MEGRKDDDDSGDGTAMGFDSGGEVVHVDAEVPLLGASETVRTEVADEDAVHRRDDS